MTTVWSECAWYTFPGRARTFHGIVKGGCDPGKKGLKCFPTPTTSLAGEAVEGGSSNASIKDQTGLSPSPVTWPDSLRRPDHFHVGF